MRSARVRWQRGRGGGRGQKQLPRGRWGLPCIPVCHLALPARCCTRTLAKGCNDLVELLRADGTLLQPISGDSLLRVTLFNVVQHMVPPHNIIITMIIMLQPVHQWFPLHGVCLLATSSHTGHLAGTLVQGDRSEPRSAAAYVWRELVDGTPSILALLRLYGSAVFVACIVLCYAIW
jgi:hypothetical protein